MEKSRDELMLDNVLKLLRRGKFELSGEEALVFSQCFSYLVEKLQAAKTPVVSSQEKAVSIDSKPIKKAK